MPRHLKINFKHYLKCFLTFLDYYTLMWCFVPGDARQVCQTTAKSFKQKFVNVQFEWRQTMSCTMNYIGSTCVIAISSWVYKLKDSQISSLMSGSLENSQMRNFACNETFLESSNSGNKTPSMSSPNPFFQMTVLPVLLSAFRHQHFFIFGCTFHRQKKTANVLSITEGCVNFSCFSKKAIPEGQLIILVKSTLLAANTPRHNLAHKPTYKVYFCLSALAFVILLT